MIKLFEIENSKIIPTEHCYAIKFLRDIMDNYPDKYMKIYAYLYYMNYPYPNNNPYFNMPEGDREIQILEDIEADFSTDDDLIVIAMEKIKKIYETPADRAYRGIQAMVDKLSEYMMTRPITDGRDGNGQFLVQASTKFGAMLKSLDEARNRVQAEQVGRARAGAKLAYDED